MSSGGITDGGQGVGVIGGVRGSLGTGGSGNRVTVEGRAEGLAHGVGEWNH